MENAPLKTSWRKIEDWLLANAPKIHSSLNKPAAVDSIDELKKLIGSELPLQLIELYEIHNGIESEAIASLVYGMKFISIEDAINLVNNIDANSSPLKYADSQIKVGYTLHKKRFPIADDNGTCMLCIDLDPSELGKIGQIIFIDYDCNVAIKLADSLEELFHNFQEDLYSEKYSLLAEALEDDNEWLNPIREIDPVNWFNSPTWEHIKV
ncbi:MAG: SMI1/KNR4 family protein [Proteobacteria bacterium]|nr:SMI1/KNR4 family protein [Pseudomonadota bacterium]